MKAIAKDNLISLLGSWAEQFTLLTPVKGAKGEHIFSNFYEDGFDLDYKKLNLPPKPAFMPQSEIIFEVKNNRYSEVTSSGETILFGIRPCDAAGLLQSESFMSRDKEDIYYKSRTDSTIKMVMACNGPQNETCFCTTTKTGPYAERGFDLQFYDMGDTFLVEAGSSRGKALLSSNAFSETNKEEAANRIKLFKEKGISAVPAKESIEKAMAILQNGVDSKDIWEEFGRKCIACGGCAFVCPTCTCFNIYDEVSSPDHGVRVRTWDACLYGGFTREASGHNPRPDQSSRLKRRHEHKLLHYNKNDVQDMLCGCVGCGRCSDYCPVHIGTLEIANAIVG